MTATDIFSELQTANPAAMRGSNPMRFGQVLLRAGLKRRHTEYGNVYEVVRRLDVSAGKPMNRGIRGGLKELQEEK